MKRLLSFQIEDNSYSYDAYINAKNRTLSEVINEIARKNIRNSTVKVYNFNPKLSQSIDGTSSFAILEKLNTKVDIVFERYPGDISFRITSEEEKKIKRQELYEEEFWGLGLKKADKFIIYIGTLLEIPKDNFDYLVLGPFLLTQREVIPDTFINIIRSFGYKDEQIISLFTNYYKKSLSFKGKCFI